ncbi:MULTISPECIES: phospholipase A [unclassified Ectothiorhodospira]|uniref:phospholipase A n=1 Tax=unclassified Ectothiorhodospira TaxID=2684909 RepID=UPI001EE78546|nr:MULTISPECIES: phospholipase A [unclassified Ectothiorhodospira]MCG5516740.1 phospholipase A [Ectothiorhodospira sp. 9100]MCG5519180.1 phospholipase A [Ectothiorhodospira sp. 9905]
MPRRFGRLSSLTLAFVACWPVSVAATTWEDCARIDADDERLACYDALAGERTDAAPATEGLTAIELPESEPAEPPAREPAQRRSSSRLASTWGFSPDSDSHMLRVHQPNYFLLARYSDRTNDRPFAPLADINPVADQDLDSVEVKFQLSFKARLWTTHDRRWGVWAGYTQQSQWQVYNEDVSRPFRETNYAPELILSYHPGLHLGGFDWEVLNLGFLHHSNGRSEILSRSWNRLYAGVGLERDNLALMGRLWYRLPEGDHQDDNPDITDYYGHGDLTVSYGQGGHRFTGTVRGNPSTGRGALSASWTSPPVLGPLRGYVQVFSGYGESLIDYNWYQNTLGLGVTLNDLVD